MRPSTGACGWVCALLPSLAFFLSDHHHRLRSTPVSLSNFGPHLPMGCMSRAVKAKSGCSSCPRTLKSSGRCVRAQPRVVLPTHRPTSLVWVLSISGVHLILGCQDRVTRMIEDFLLSYLGNGRHEVGRKEGREGLTCSSRISHLAFSCSLGVWPGQ